MFNTIRSLFTGFLDLNGSDPMAPHVTENPADDLASSSHVHTSGHPLSLAEPMRASELGPTSGIDRLSEVIMSLIFEEGKIDDQVGMMFYRSNYGYKRSGRQRLPFPLLVSHVSRRWNYIALQSATLWNQILLSRERNQLAFLFLERSHQCLIDITIHLGMDDTIDPEPWLNHFDRCRSLSIDVAQASVDDTVKTLQLFRDISAPQLRNLVIAIEYELVYSHEGYSEIPGHLFGGGAPMLTVIKIRGIGLDQCLPPLGAATRLSLDSWRTENVVIGVGDYVLTLNAIGKASALTHLTLCELPLGNPIGRTRVTIDLPNLLSLKVISPNAILEADTYFDYLFSSLILPNLQHLTLKHCHDYDLDGLITSTHITRERHPSHLRVKSISLYETKVDVWNIDSLSDLFPDVERLAISFGDESDGVSLLEFLEEAEVGDDDAYTLWPLLKQVCVATSKQETGDREIEGTLRAFVQSRIAVGLPLQNIIVPAWSTAYDPSWYADRGIKIQFCHELPL
ncbi:hypothetical protein HWV62_37890 [Athelia sp. TMB]|nr:hypothetical protein HWV62_37890 [Athelia sp. TMB]